MTEVTLSYGFPVLPIEAIWADRAFFAEHPDRKLRIRTPILTEYEREFQTMGLHQKSRERVIVTRVTPDISRSYGFDFMRIPLLQAADETIEDRDDILAPVLKELMAAAQP